jgi:hypothetical protein
MLSLGFLFELLFGKSPPAKVRFARTDELFQEARTRGVAILGDPSTGKTKFGGMQIVKGWINDPHAVFVFDWSGSITNTILDLLSRHPDYERLFDKVVLDELGNEEWVIPKPGFHPSYGLTNEEQVNRVLGNMKRLSEFLLKGAPFLGTVSIDEIGRELFRLLTVIRNQHGENWQITEAKRLLLDLPLLRKACAMFGAYAPAAKWYFEHEYLPKDFMKASEKELTARSLRYLLSQLEAREVRATLGYHKPGYTEKEATENDLLVIIDAHWMINQPEAQHYLLMQRFSQVMTWINKREVDDPNNKLAEIDFDETYTILKIEGMAEWLGMVSPLYRSRKVGIMILAQALWQFDESFAKQLWTLGTICSFAISNGEEAELIARQLFDYDPKYQKNAPKTPYQNPTTEPVTGQDRMYADWIQNLKPRQFIMRRYETEQKKEKGVLFVEKTSEYPTKPPHVSLKEVKDYLRRSRGVKVRDALEVIVRRDIKIEKKEVSRPTIR